MKNQKDCSENQNIPQLQNLTREVPSGLHGKIMQSVHQTPQEAKPDGEKARVLHLPRRVVGTVAAALVLCVCIGVIAAVGIPRAGKTADNSLAYKASDRYDTPSGDYYMQSSDNYYETADCPSQADDAITPGDIDHVTIFYSKAAYDTLILYTDGSFTLGSQFGEWHLADEHDDTGIILTFVNDDGNEKAVHVILDPETSSYQIID